MKTNKKSQISSIEVIFVVGLFILILSYLNFTPDNQYQNNIEIRINSLIDSIYYIEEFRNNIFEENLSSSQITGNWTNLSLYLNNSLSDFSFSIENKTNLKNILNCSMGYDNYSQVEFFERILFIKNNTFFEQRKIKIGVCYN